MPTTCPRSFTRAPPELPALRAAEVWMRVMEYPPTGRVRLVAEMMPSVMDPVRYPRGLPMA